MAPLIPARSASAADPRTASVEPSSILTRGRPSPTTRNLAMVIRPGWLTEYLVSIPDSAAKERRDSPAASSPTTVTRSTEAPRPARLAATLAAPPSTSRLSVASTTGKGPSGQSLSTDPLT